MPHTENTHASTEIINPVASAFHHYITQLQEQYPGILTEFSLEASNPNNPNTYQIHGRLFFDKFNINKEDFDFKYDPLSPQQINTILAPLYAISDQIGLSLDHPNTRKALLSQFRALRQTVFDAVLIFLPNPIDALTELQTVIRQDPTKDIPQECHKKIRNILTTEINYFYKLISQELALIQSTVAAIQPPHSAEESLENMRLQDKEQMIAIKQAIHESAFLYLKEASNKLSLKPHDYLSQALQDCSKTIEELIGRVSNLTPEYTKEKIEHLLKYREDIYHAILTSDGINLLNGFFVFNSQDLKAAEAIQAQARAATAGAVLFKVISEAEIRKICTLPVALKKFITKIANTADHDVENTLATLQQLNETNIRFNVSPAKLFEVLEEPNAEKRKIDLDATMSGFSTTLEKIVSQYDFISFGAHSFIVLFQQLKQSSENLFAHEEIQLAYNTKILNFMVKHFHLFRSHASAIPHAIELLELMHFEKKHLHLHSSHRQHQHLLSRCRARPATQETMQKFNQLVRKASQDVEAEEALRNREKFDANKKRSQSTNTLKNTDNTAQAELAEEHKRDFLKIKRGLSSFNLKKLTLRRAATHDGAVLNNPVEEVEKPILSRVGRKKKLRSPEVPRKQRTDHAGSPPKHDSSSASTSPPVTQRYSKKPRKEMEPTDEPTNHTAPIRPITEPGTGTLFSSSPPPSPKNTRKTPEVEVYEPSMHTLKPLRPSG